MKKIPFFSVMLITNMLFILLHLHKYSAITTLSSSKQHYEQELAQLCQDAQACNQELCELHDKSTVMRYAEQYLNMAQVTPDQIKKLNMDLSL